jgi:hypothetical protein
MRLVTPEEKAVLYELSQAAHKRVLGNLKSGQDWRQELVAESVGRTLAQVVGISWSSNAAGHTLIV